MCNFTLIMVLGDHFITGVFGFIAITEFMHWHSILASALDALRFLVKVMQKS